VARLRIATFNLLHGVSLTDGSVDEARLRRAAETLDADVVGLQEVDRGLPRSHGVDQAAAVADALEAPHWRFLAAVHGTPGLDGQWTPALDEDEPGTGSYGIALLSRYPVREWRTRRFPAAPVGMPLMLPGRRGLARVPDEPRTALAAVVEAPCGPITVLTAHLSFVPGWNVRQLRAIVRWVSDLPSPRIIAGDLNLPSTLPRQVTGWEQLARLPTYPAQRPTVQFDHVLGLGVTRDDVVGATAMMLPVSDHCALAVDL
jgi:endonuclease/exonuclease/phosphatase family metal-dependent hydrolase